MKIEIEWEDATRESEAWNYRQVLYAYLNPSTEEIGYIGSAFYRSVGQRFDDLDKVPLFDFLEDEWETSGVEVIVGDLCFDGRLTRQLLFDAESLLITRLSPIGNIQCKKTRISRSGLKLECFNRWPHARTRFWDKG